MSIPVTAHFGTAEFDCHDGSIYPAGKLDEDTNDGRTWLETRLKPLCDTLEAIREAAGNLPMTIDSGYRTEAYDARIHDAHIAALAAQGLPDDHLVAEPTSSQHPMGRAADVTHSKLSPVALFNLALQLFEAGKLPALGGIGLYRNFVHLDVRPRSNGGAHLAIWGGSRPSNVV